MNKLLNKFFRSALGSNGQNLSSNSNEFVWRDIDATQVKNESLIPGSNLKEALDFLDTLEPIQFTQQPQDQSIRVGETATLSVAATGSPSPTFQWYQGTVGDTNTPVGTGSSITVSPSLTGNYFYWVRATNAVGSVDSNQATVEIALMTQTSKITASDRADFGFDSGDQFGESVAISGNLAIIGAWLDEDGVESDSGSVYLFDISNPSNPVEKAKITASDGAESDFFGRDVAIDGNLVVVGAPNKGDYQGAVYFYDVSNPSSPVEIAQLSAENTTINRLDNFGGTVVLENNLLMVGSGEDIGSDVGAGAIYLYDVSNPSNPINTSKITEDSTIDRDLIGFGNSIAIDGNLMVVGVREGNFGFTADPPTPLDGAFYVYDVSDPSNPIERSRTSGLANDGVESMVGVKVAIQGNLVITVAYPANDLVLTFASDNASAFIFDISNPASPVKISRIETDDFGVILGVADSLGLSVAIEGNMAVLGAPSEQFNGLYKAGAVYIFDISDPVIPIKKEKLIPSDFSELKDFGRTLAVNSDVILIGTPNDNLGPINSPSPLNNAGAAYLYDISSLT